MQTRQYSQNVLTPPYLIARIIVETLKQTNGDSTISMIQIADQAKTTLEQVRRVLGRSLEVEEPTGAHLGNSDRFKLAVEAVRNGALQQVARALTWQEFESFTEECLQSAGFETKKGIIVKDDARRWQIDVIATRGSIILAVDCKHWESPGYHSKLSKAAEHQRLAVQALFWQMSKRGDLGSERVLALPIILTLFEPRSRLVGGAVMVSVEQFADFLDGVSPYSSELPFVHAQDAAKSSIS